MGHDDVGDTETTIDRLCTVEEAAEVRRELVGDMRSIYVKSREQGRSHQRAMGAPFRVEC